RNSRSTHPRVAGRLLVARIRRVLALPCLNFLAIRFIVLLFLAFLCNLIGEHGACAVGAALKRIRGVLQRSRKAPLLQWRGSVVKRLQLLLELGLSPYHLPQRTA